MKNLMTRALSGIAFVALVVACILVNQFTFFTLICIVVGLSLNEFNRITPKILKSGAPKGLDLLGILVAFAALTISLLTAMDVLPIAYLACIPAMLLLFFIRQLGAVSENPFMEIGLDVLGFVWLVVPFMAAIFIAFEYGQFAGKPILAIFIIVWLYDSLAYLVGSTIGKRPLFKRISPKKTIEGLVGGAALTLLAVLFLHRFFPLFPLIDALMVSAIAIIFGTLGDLVESMLKRSVDIKDSGNIMPGHGGVLDRFDAMFLALPAVAAYILLFV